MRKVLIFGSRGYLGSAFGTRWQANGLEVCAASRADITDRQDIEASIREARPDVILNAAGVTHGDRSQNIDGCEESALRWARTYHVNAPGAWYVAQAAFQAHIPLVHLSSGCVFDGLGPFSESSPPQMLNWYTATKVAGERYVQEAHPHALIIRLRMPFDASSHSRNLLTKLSGYAKVIDALNSLTAVSSLLTAVDGLLARHATGIVHVANPGPVSPYAIACQMAKAEGRTLPEPITAAELDALTTAKRSNCVLDTRLLSEHYGVTLPTAQSVLDECIDSLRAKAVHA